MLHRCSIRRTCGARRALPRHIDNYTRRPLCPGCGRDTLKPDAAGTLRNRALTCKCSGWPHPHNKGAKWCVLYIGEYTDDDYLDRK